MSWTLPFLLSALAGYVSGATPFGYFAGRLKGIDIREHGSKNIGATNVVRVCGKGIGIPVFILDVLKGWLPAWLVLTWFASHGAGVELSTIASIVTGIAAVLGHNYTFWLKGRGGKGIATSTGALLAVAPVAVGVGLVVWYLTLKLTQYVSVASMVAALAIPITMSVMMLRDGSWNFILLGFGVVLCMLAIVRHKTNIERLMAGTENRVGQKKKEVA
ncbi:MAG: glycerol-3-phosphate 1-O-acyltransferase PlsY [Verrucomicrobiaceae bacterium]|nr:glycerol-3-phosphate 1-O-acyltransferase PlsY [Verrucomicrobiaceae bacterium]